MNNSEKNVVFIHVSSDDFAIGNDHATKPFDFKVFLAVKKTLMRVSCHGRSPRIVPITFDDM